MRGARSAKGRCNRLAAPALSAPVLNMTGRLDRHVLRMEISVLECKTIDVEMQDEMRGNCRAGRRRGPSMKWPPHCCQPKIRQVQEELRQNWVKLSSGSGHVKGLEAGAGAVQSVQGVPKARVKRAEDDCGPVRGPLAKLLRSQSNMSQFRDTPPPTVTTCYGGPISACVHWVPSHTVGLS